MTSDWADAVVHVTWQGALVGALAWGLVSWRRDGAAWWRCLLLGLACAKFVVPPWWSCAVGVLPSLARTSSVQAGFVTTDESSSAPSAVVVSSGQVPVVPRPPMVEPLPIPPPRDIVALDLPEAPSADTEAPIGGVTCLLLLHGLGTTLVLLWVVRDVCRLRRLVRGSTPATGRLLRAWCEVTKQREPSDALRPFASRLLVSAALDVPCAFGLWRPTVLMPKHLVDALSDAELRTVLMHERTHLRHGDAWAQCAQLSVLAFWWFHPVVWCLGSAWRRAREDWCDDAVVRRGITSRSDYCNVLLRVAAARRDGMELGLAHSMVPGRRGLTRRFHRLLNSNQRRDHSPMMWTLSLPVVALACLPGLPAQEDPGLVFAEDLRQVSDGFAQPRAVDQEEATSLSSADLAASVDRALAWLAKSQHADGTWGDGPSSLSSTGLSVLAYLGYGITPQTGPHQTVVERGLNALRESQHSNGRFTEAPLRAPVGGPSGAYGQAIATLALSEALALTGDESLRKPAQRAVDCICRARNPDRAWRYGDHEGDNDSLVTSWMLYALFSAKASDLEVDPQAIRSGLAFLTSMTDPTTGRTGYDRRGSVPARQVGDSERWPPERVEPNTAQSLFVHALAGTALDQTPSLAAGLNLLASKPPQWDATGSIDFLYWYFGTATMWHAGASEWDAWAPAVASALAGHQVTRGPDAGSWDPSVDPWGDVGGRSYVTALNVLTLTIPVRVARLWDE